MASVKYWEQHVRLPGWIQWVDRLDEAEQNAREALPLGGRAANRAHPALASINGERNDYRAEAQEIQSYLRLEPNDSNQQELREILAVVRRLAYNTAKSK